jgi:large subunit ribosomal protein L17
MRHSKKIIKLGRKSSHRKFMLANMASSLIDKKRISTTLTKAKALKIFFEPLVTKSKSDTTHNRRIVFRSLRNKEAVSELFRNISKKIGDRPGGYTRIIKLGNRLGDNASMAMIELVDYNEIYKLEKSEKKKSTRRGRRSKKKADDVEKDQVDLKKVEDKPADQTPDQVDSEKVEDKPADQAPDQVDSEKVEDKPADQAPDQVDSEKVEDKPADQTPDQSESAKTKKKSIETSIQKSGNKENIDDSKDEGE